MGQPYSVEINGGLFEFEAESPEQAKAIVDDITAKMVGAQAPAPQQQQQQGPVDPWAAQAQKINQAGSWDEGAVGQAFRPAAAGLVAGTVAGFGQLAVYGSEAASRVLGVESPLGTLAEYNSAANDLLKSIRGADKPEDWSMPRVVETIAEFAPALALPNPTASSLKLKDVAVNGLKAGGYGAAIMFDDADTLSEKTSSIALGSLAGLGLSAGINIAGATAKAGHKWWVGKMANQRDDAHREAIINVVNQFPELKEWLTIGQRTGSAAMLDSEARAAGKYALATYRKQAEILGNGLRQFAQRYGAGFDPMQLAASVGRRGTQVGRSYLRDLRQVRNQEWDAMMGAAEGAITARKIASQGIEGAEQSVIPIGDLENALMDMADRYGFAANKMDFGAAVQRLRKEAAAFNGNVSMETFVDTLKKMNSDNFTVASGQGSNPLVNDAIAKDFRQMMFDIVDNAPDNVNDAITWVKRARQSYSQRMTQIEEFQKSAISEALGTNGPVKDPVEALMSIGNLSRGEQAKAREILSKYDPQLLNEMRGQFWDQALQKAQVTSRGTPNQAGFDIDKFLLEMMDGGELRQAGLYSESEAAMMKEILPDLRAINYKLNSMAKAPELENTAMTAGQGIKSGFANMAFVARQGFRFYNKFFDERYFTPAGRAALRAAAVAKDPAALDAALGRLIVMSGVAPGTLGMEPEE